jgi:hypothetical protein
MGEIYDAVEMGSGAMMYVPSFAKAWFRPSELDKGGFTDTQDGDWISLL